jgi:hypothetical protein
VKVIIICQAVKRDKGLTGDRQPFNNLFSGLSPILVVLWCCKKKRTPTRRTLHAGVNTHKGANGSSLIQSSYRGAICSNEPLQILHVLLDCRKGPTAEHEEQVFLQPTSKTPDGGNSIYIIANLNKKVNYIFGAFRRSI